MVGIDYEVLGLRAAQDVLDQPLLSCASANRLPFASETFDFAVMSELIEHLKAPRLCLAEASRVLKPGGILVVTTPHRDPSGKLHSNQHMQEFDGEELKNLLGLYFQDVTVLGMCPSHLMRRYTSRSHNARLLRAAIKVLTVLGFNPFARCGPLEERLSWDHLIAVGEVH
jgi:2-polyprenyl-3-methyl-5-hydroxy-6-metoxy-1,4-benzoquinol methylase